MINTKLWRSTCYVLHNSVLIWIEFSKLFACHTWSYCLRKSLVIAGVRCPIDVNVCQRFKIKFRLSLLHCKHWTDFEIIVSRSQQNVIHMKSNSTGIFYRKLLSMNSQTYWNVFSINTEWITSFGLFVCQKIYCVHSINKNI